MSSRSGRDVAAGRGEAAAERGVPMLLYEAGEGLRFDELSIRAGVKGIIGVMRELGMLPKGSRRRKPPPEPIVARASSWVRAPQSGILRACASLGAKVRKNDRLALIADPVAERECEVRAPTSGIIIGRITIPLVHEGEALFHIARFEDLGEVAQQVEAFQQDELETDFPGLEAELYDDE